MRILTGIIAGTLIAGFSASAMAETNGWYAGAETGLNIVPEMKYKGNEGAKAHTDPGFGLLGQVGYGFGAVRVEGELGWRYNDIDKLGGMKGKGTIEPLTFMANAYYDFDTGTPWTPFIGAGVGGADLMVNKARIDNNTSPIFDDGDMVFAYQGIAGVSYAINDQLSIKGDYRYLGTTDGNFKVKNDDGDHVKSSYSSHAIMVGFTYQFEAPSHPAPMARPAAAPAAAPAPAPKMTQAPLAKSYQVFFDFNKADITPEANSIIQKAADSAKAENATTISLTGHTDSVGSDKYNMALSLRRANAVKVALVKQGVPANEISVVGKGKADQLVPTKDGVREPQNRRVQILLP